jgi:hypothetical protein
MESKVYSQEMSESFMLGASVMELLLSSITRKVAKIIH